MKKGLIDFVVRNRYMLIYFLQYVPSRLFIWLIDNSAFSAAKVM